MELIAPKKDLLRLVARCQGVADRKNAMPALSNVLLDAQGNVLRVSATDMFLSLTGTIQADVAQAGLVAVPARELHDRVRAMPDGPISLTLSGATQLIIKASGSPRRFTLPAIPGSDFPALPRPDEQAASLSVPVDLLSRLIARTHFSISTDETRAHVNSALFEWDANRVRMVTTDGHRLSKAESSLPTPATTQATMLVPMKAISELRRLADDAKSDASGSSKGESGKADSADIIVKQSGPNAFFELGGIHFGVKLVDAQFPPYQQVIPKSTERAIRTPRKAFADALDAVRIAASERTGGVRLTSGKGVLRITSESPESGHGFDEIPVDFEGNDVTIGFNAKYFIDVLTAIDDEEVLVGISGELDPATLRPATESSTDEFVAVIMPMRI